MKSNKPFTFCSVIAVLFFVLAIDVFAKDRLIIDIKNEQTFMCVRADDLITTFQASPQNAHDKYDGEYCMVLGNVTSVDSKGDSFVITSVKTQYNTAIQKKTSITCKAGMFDAEVKEQIKELKIGQNVRVYCQPTVWTVGVADIYINDVIKVVQTDETDIKGGYTLLNGKTMAIDDFNKVVIKDDNDNDLFSYYVPPEWNGIEIPAVLGRYDIPGYQYKLNELSDTKAVTPEHLFAFYFDNSTFVKAKKNWTSYDNIEVSIVENIVPEEKYTSSKKEKLPNGLEYVIYDVNYTDERNAFHRVEFVFIPDKVDEGVVVFMYVFNDENHVDDIILLLRTFEME